MRHRWSAPTSFVLAALRALHVDHSDTVTGSAMIEERTTTLPALHVGDTHADEDQIPKSPHVHAWRPHNKNQNHGPGVSPLQGTSSVTSSQPPHPRSADTQAPAKATAGDRRQDTRQLIHAVMPRSRGNGGRRQWCEPRPMLTTSEWCQCITGDPCQLDIKPFTVRLDLISR